MLRSESFQARSRFSGVCEPSNSVPIVLMCEEDRITPSTLSIIGEAHFRKIQVSDMAGLRAAVAETSPDIIVLSNEFLHSLFIKERFQGEALEDLEYALDDQRPRDADVIRMLAKGLRNQEIANNLGLRIRTVKAILTSLYLRHDVTNRTELLGQLMEEGHSRAYLRRKGK